jgi:hypothetical protein
MKSTIKSIPITKVNEGMQVYWSGCPSKVKVWYILEVKSDWVECCPIYQKLNPIRSQSAKISELKTIVVEYEEEQPHLFIGFGKKPPPITKQIPLKNQDWQQAIDLGLVDSGKEVDVKIVTITGKGHGSRDVFAKLVTQQRDYTDIVELGDGAGQLFVKGSYDAIKTLQSKLLELEQLKVKLKNQSK